LCLITIALQAICATLVPITTARILTCASIGVPRNTLRTPLWC
jgi:hypothetical protein